MLPAARQSGCRSSYALFGGGRDAAENGNGGNDLVTVEFGKENRDAIVLLHGGGLSWWGYREAAQLLQTRFHVVLPVLDGHAGSDTRFVSIERNAEELLAYIDAHLDGRVLAVGGLSLGAQIAAEMLARRRGLCRYAVLESALVFPMPAVRSMLRPAMDMAYGLIGRPWFSRLQFRSLNLNEAYYPDYFRDTRRIAKEDMLAFLTANADYAIKPALRLTSARTLILVGGREQRNMLRSARALHETIGHSSLRVLKGYTHGALSINHAEEYAGLLMDWIEQTPPAGEP